MEVFFSIILREKDGGEKLLCPLFKRKRRKIRKSRKTNNLF